MGGNSSHVLTVFDVVRVREWLLLTLHGRFRIESARKVTTQSGSSSIQSFLLQTFQRYDTTSNGVVEHEAALVIAHDLTLDNKWTHEQIEGFCELFTPLEDDNSERFNYRLFVSFLFFPVERQPSKLKLRQSVTRVGLFDVYSGELVSGILGLGQQDDDGGIPVIAKKLSLLASGFNNNQPAMADSVKLLRDQVNCLHLYSHPNISRYVTTIQTKDALYVVEVSHESCTLKTILESFGAMKEPTIRRYLLQLLQGLQYLHTRDIAHGNLSTRSVNIDSYGLLKLSEFGIGQQLKQLIPSSKELLGETQDWTTKFPPPEASKAGLEPHPGKHSDVWGVGILVLQMANGFSRDNEPTTSSSPSKRSFIQRRSPLKHPQSGSPLKKTSFSAPKSHTNQTSTLPTLPQTASKALRNLVRACLQRNPRKRANVDQLIEMDFFQVDVAQATNEMLRTVCTDLDASMKRLISHSSASPKAKLRPGSPVRTLGRLPLTHNKYMSFVPPTGNINSH